MQECEKESTAYKKMKRRYIELKVILLSHLTVLHGLDTCLFQPVRKLLKLLDAVQLQECEKESTAYKKMKRRYIELKVILTASGHAL